MQIDTVVLARSLTLTVDRLLYQQKNKQPRCSPFPSFSRPPYLGESTEVPMLSIVESKGRFVGGR